jgi:hypothetical protein
MKKLIVLFLIVLGLLAIVPAIDIDSTTQIFSRAGIAEDDHTVVPTPHQVAPRQPGVIATVRKLPEGASADVLRVPVRQLMRDLRATKATERSAVYEALSLLGRHSAAVELVAEEYRRLETTDYAGRVFAVGALGQMRRPEALPILRDIVWAPLPPAIESEYLSPREHEERVRMRAVYGIGYLRNEAAFAELVRIIQTHPSHAVRIAAVRSFAWNKNFHPEALTNLRSTADERYHRFISRTGASPEPSVVPVPEGGPR